MAGGEAVIIVCPARLLPSLSQQPPEAHLHKPRVAQGEAGTQIKDSQRMKTRGTRAFFVQVPPRNVIEEPQPWGPGMECTTNYVDCKMGTRSAKSLPL